MPDPVEPHDLQDQSLSIPLASLTSSSGSTAASLSSASSAQSRNESPAIEARQSLPISPHSSSSQTSSQQATAGTTRPNSLAKTWRDKLRKDVKPAPACGIFIAILALVWAIKSFNEAAHANDLALRESCRSHPHDQALQATDICKTMQKAHDFDDLARRHGDSSSFIKPTSRSWKFGKLETSIVLYILFAVSASVLRASTVSTRSKIWKLNKISGVWFLILFPLTLVLALHGIAGMLVYYLYRTSTAMLLKWVKRAFMKSRES